MRPALAAAAFMLAVSSWPCFPAGAAELTDLASSFEPNKPFGFKLGATYQFTYKTAHITREAVPLLQNSTTKNYLYKHLGLLPGQSLQTTEVTPDLFYMQRRQTMSIDLAVGLYRDLQLGVSLPLVLRDERQYDLDRNAGFNTCGANDFGCIASASTTFLDGIYPILPNTQSGMHVFSPPVRGGSGKNLLDTINLSLSGAPVSQRRDPTKPTWVIGLEADISIGNIMAYDNTRGLLPANSPLQAFADGNQLGWNGVSDGLNRFILHTALSHKFRYVDPYLGLYYMYPLPRTWDTDGSPWKTDYGFAQQRSAPQQQAGVRFGFEATPLENKAKGHRLAFDFRAGLQFHFLGRGYSEAWELLASSNALVCDDQTALPGTFLDPSFPKPVTQGFFNPACRTPGAANSTMPRLPASEQKATAAVSRPYNGLSLIENYLSFQAELGIVIELFRHLRVRLSASYMRDQGHAITLDDAGNLNYPDNNRLSLNNPLNADAAHPTGRGCDGSHVDLKCPYDWNPLYRQSINVPGRRYRVDDVNLVSGAAMLQGYF